MTREEIERDYEVVDGRITSLGKFQGEMLYVVFYYNAALEGFADRDNGPSFGFNVSDADRAMFPELKGRKTVDLYERCDGFVCEV